MMNFLAPYKLYAYAGLVILIALIVSLHLYNDVVALNELKDERDKAVKDLKDLKDDIKLKTAEREAENANKRVAGLAKTQAIQAEHETALKQRDLDRAKSTQAIKDFYEKRLNINHFTASERLRIEAERRRFGLPEISETPQRLAEGGRICDATLDYENLERACAITTLDFNLCRETLDADTEMVGRDE